MMQKAIEIFGYLSARAFVAFSEAPPVNPDAQVSDTMVLEEIEVANGSAINLVETAAFTQIV
jgi:hypothetical protein